MFCIAAGEYEKDINIVNPLGMKGQLATAFAQMISSLWSGTCQSFAPTKIKVNHCHLFRTCTSKLLLHTHACTHTNTIVLRLSGLCLRRNIHPPTPILIISHPLSASFIYCNPWHPPFISRHLIFYVHILRLLLK